MNRIKCKIAYDGSGFSGYQVQPNGRTVQEEIERVLKAMHKGENVKVVASGRTDAGVHAKGQVIHFNTSLRLPDDRWPAALNSQLPADISVLSAERCGESFHARYSAVGKEYRYRIYQETHRDPLLRHYAHHFPYQLDIEAMEQAAAHLIGRHDFTSFCSARTEVEDKVREIKKIEVLTDGTEIELRFVGNGFLYNMVRIITGTLLDVGSGKIPSDEIKNILKGKNRALAGKTAPAMGLYLWEVFYSN
ncbi:tRNA pseudouridine38-40 synthase [Bacillus ectoiniformans]|uniref:tRNA pseudouridine(38-40) synthase TruA n=1 Tax=Bacillus ectoiniformans TaxID=1494429 RepID=UPI00195D0819|nr:tRNA pseudouridine(38-40) synthase TruA [Bacillus ectoiniformans]MBM7650544.1 tRNA pseudouridine38-40 synthase [Bacillus ectoiniformans]